MTKFSRFDLRTTNVDAARAFYSKVLGHGRASIWPLHEQALARGARPHWLGHLGVADLEEATAAFLRRGATRLGPMRPTPDGGQCEVLRDRGGAVVALASLPADGLEQGVTVVWHVLNTHGPDAPADYRELFGWALHDRLELGALGSYLHFAWDEVGPVVGAITDIASRPDVHPHWLFFFEVALLERAMALTREAGGHALEPMVLAGGERLCVCDDPQGAAFGLRERRP